MTTAQPPRLRHDTRWGRRSCHVDVSVDIALPAEAVYDFLADIQDVEPIPRRAKVRMRKQPLGPTRVGTGWHESVRFAPGLWMHVDSVATRADRPGVLAMTFHSVWWSGGLRYDIESTAHGCRLRHRETLVPCAALQPMTGVIERRLRNAIIERLRDIRDVVSDSFPRSNSDPST